MKKDPKFRFEPIVVTTICKLCKIEVEQDLDYHFAGGAGFSYSCGCKSTHTKQKDTWASKDGNTLEVPTGE